MIVIFAGIVAQVAYNLISCILRALGDSRTPLYFLIFSSVLNVGALVAISFGVSIANYVGQNYGAGDIMRVRQGVGKTFMPLMAGVVELLIRGVASFTLPNMLGYLGITLIDVLAWVGDWLLSPGLPHCRHFRIVIASSTDAAVTYYLIP